MRKRGFRSFNLAGVRPSPIRTNGIKRTTAYRRPEKLLSLKGVVCADCVGAVMVSVEVTEFAPGVTDVEDREQVAKGVEPATLHDS